MAKKRVSIIDQETGKRRIAILQNDKVKTSDSKTRHYTECPNIREQIYKPVEKK